MNWMKWLSTSIYFNCLLSLESRLHISCSRRQHSCEYWDIRWISSRFCSICILVSLYCYFTNFTKNFPKWHSLIRLLYVDKGIKWLMMLSILLDTSSIWLSLYFLRDSCCNRVCRCSSFYCVVLFMLCGCSSS